MCLKSLLVLTGTISCEGSDLDGAIGVTGCDLCSIVVVLAIVDALLVLRFNVNH